MTTTILAYTMGHDRPPAISFRSVMTDKTPASKAAVHFGGSTLETKGYRTVEWVVKPNSTTLTNSPQTSKERSSVQFRLLNLRFSALLLGIISTPLILLAEPEVRYLRLYAPADSISEEGNTNAAGPFWPGQGRYQQVFAASDFLPMVSTQGMWCAVISFRGPAPMTVWSIENQVEVHLSTTKREPDQLSPIFAENVGTNDTLVVSGKMHATAACGPSACLDFTFGIYFWNYFYYDPREGNLLFDFRVVVPHTLTNGLHGLDAWDRPNDTVSSVYSGLGSSLTGAVQTFGFATQIDGYPTPQLEVQADSTGALVLSWPNVPTAVVLQRSARLDNQTSWETVTNGVVISPSGNLKSFTLAKDSIGIEQFYRLVCPTKSPPTPNHP